MTAEADAVLDALDGKSRVTVRRGTYVSLNSRMRAVVDLGTSRFEAEFTTGLIPEVGEVVDVLTVDEKVLLLGPTGAKPGQGTVTAVAAPYATVQMSTGTRVMPYVGTAPAVNDIVAVGWSEGPRCLGKLSISPPPVIPPPDPGPAVQLRSATFLVTDTGSTDRGAARWWTDQPWASDSTFGAWFYGSQIKDTIPAGAEFVSLEFHVSRVQDSGAAPNFAVHNQQSKAGVPSYGPSTAWDPGNGWQTPPDPSGWFASLKSGGSWQGIGLNQGGFNKFASRSQDGMSGALRISWRA